MRNTQDDKFEYQEIYHGLEHKRNEVQLKKFGTGRAGTTRSRVGRVFKRLRLCMEAEHTCSKLGARNRHVIRAPSGEGKGQLSVASCACAARALRLSGAFADEC